MKVAIVQEVGKNILETDELRGSAGPCAEAFRYKVPKDQC